MFRGGISSAWANPEGTWRDGRTPGVEERMWGGGTWPRGLGSPGEAPGRQVF